MTDPFDNFGQGQFGAYGGGYGGGYGPNYGGYNQPFGGGYGPSGAFVGAQRNTWTLGPYTGYGPQGRIPSDQRIEDEVIDRMTMHGHLDARNIQVKVQNREVTLSGNVDSRQAKRLAEDIADSVPGVVDVHNELKIQGQQGQQGQQAGQHMQQPTGQQMQTGQSMQGGQTAQTTAGQRTRTTAATSGTATH